MKRFKIINDIIQEESSSACSSAMTSADATNATKASTGLPIEKDEDKEIRLTKEEWCDMTGMTDEEYLKKLQKQKKKL